MPSQSQINYRNRQLFLSCRNLMDKQFQNDDEAVRDFRDGYIAQNFEGRNYKELSFEELGYAISELNRQARGECKAEKRTTITFNQLKLIKFYVIGLALHYTWFGNLNVKVDGVQISHQEIRELFQSKFNNRETLPKEAINYMYINWINPRCNEWLVEGNFKKYVNRPEILYYEQLTQEAATYLIKRLTQMWNQVNIRDAAGHTYDYNRN